MATNNTNVVIVVTILAKDCRMMIEEIAHYTQISTAYAL